MRVLQITFITFIALLTIILSSCSEDKVVKVQIEDIEWVGPLNSTHLFLQSIQLTSNESGHIFYLLHPYSQFHLSGDNGDSWSELSLPSYPHSDSTNYKPYIKGGNDQSLYLFKDGITFFSSDNGVNWQIFKINNLAAYILDISNSGLIYSSVYDTTNRKKYIFKSSDGGVTWLEILNLFNYGDIESFTTDDNDKIYILTTIGDIYSKDNNSSTWQLVKSSIFGDSGKHFYYDMKVVNQYIFIYDKLFVGFMKFDTLGNKYDMDYIYANKVRDLVQTNEREIFIASDDGLYISKNFGETWEKIPCPINDIFDMELTQKGYLFISNDKKIYRSKNMIK